MPTTEPAPDSSPETPLARDIAMDLLTKAVNSLRADIQAQGATQNLRLTTVLDALARFDGTMKLFAAELQTLKRGQLDHEERIGRLEARAFREGPAKKKGARRAANSR